MMADKERFAVNPLPMASVSRGADPIGGLTMATEIMAGHHVRLFWPGTTALTDPLEKAAIVELYQQMSSFFYYYDVADSNSTMRMKDFLADYENLDPCGSKS